MAHALHLQLLAHELLSPFRPPTSIRPPGGPVPARGRCPCNAIAIHAVRPLVPVDVIAGHGWVRRCQLLRTHNSDPNERSIQGELSGVRRNLGILIPHKVEVHFLHDIASQSSCLNHQISPSKYKSLLKLCKTLARSPKNTVNPSTTP